MAFSVETARRFMSLRTKVAEDRGQRDSVLTCDGLQVLCAYLWWPAGVVCLPVMACRCCLPSRCSFLLCRELKYSLHTLQCNSSLSSCTQTAHNGTSSSLSSWTQTLHNGTMSSCTQTPHNGTSHHCHPGHKHNTMEPCHHAHKHHTMEPAHHCHPAHKTLHNGTSSSLILHTAIQHTMDPHHHHHPTHTHAKTSHNGTRQRVTVSCRQRRDLYWSSLLERWQLQFGSLVPR